MSEVHINYGVIQNDCRGFNNLSYTIHLRYENMFFLFNRTTLQGFVTYLTGALQVHPLCSTNMNTIIEFVPHVSGDGFSDGSDSCLQFRDTHAPCLFKLCIPPSNGTVRYCLFEEFGAELPLDNCTPTIILNTPVYVEYTHNCINKFLTDDTNPSSRARFHLPSTNSHSKFPGRKG